MEKLESLQKTLPYVDKKEMAGIVEFIKQSGFFIHREERGMVMCEVNDSFSNPFFLGEILVCEVEVEHRDARGYGMVIGDNTEHALIMASADSAYVAGDDIFISRLVNLISPATARMQESLLTEKKFTASTKVEFGLMVEG